MSSILGQRLLESEYGKKLINMDLVKKIESYLNISFVSYDTWFMIASRSINR